MHGCSGGGKWRGGPDRRPDPPPPLYLSQSTLNETQGHAGTHARARPRLQISRVRRYQQQTSLPSNERRPGRLGQHRRHLAAKVKERGGANVYMSESGCWDLQANEGGGGKACCCADAGVQRVIVRTQRPDEAAANELFSLSTFPGSNRSPLFLQKYRDGGLGHLGPHEEICNNGFDFFFFFFQSARTNGRSDVATATSRVGLDGPV